MDRIRKTSVSIVGEDFYINGRPTYAGCFYREWRIEGLLLNARMVQATFDDLNPATRSLWNEPDGRPFDAERNTDSFIAQLPEWHAMGLLAVTLNLQGGSPQGYSREQPWINSAFAADLVGAAHALGNLAARRHSAGAGRANRLAAVEQCSNCELAGYDRADWLVLRAARN